MDSFRVNTQCILYETILGEYSKNKKGNTKIGQDLYGQQADLAKRSRNHLKEYLKFEPLMNFLREIIKRGFGEWLKVRRVDRKGGRDLEVKK